MTTQVDRPPKYPRGKNPISLANLKPPWKKGENGHGRVYPLKERLYHALDKPLTEPKPGAPVGERLVYATLKGALDLVPAPFHETWDRVEGKVPEVHKMEGDTPVLHTFFFVLSDGTRITPGQVIEGQARVLPSRTIANDDNKC